MPKESNEKKQNASVAEAAIFFLACQVVIQGLSFLSISLFSRLMSKEEFGAVSNFSAWFSIIMPIITLNLRDSIMKSKYTYAEDNATYLLSAVTASDTLILAAYLVVELFRDRFMMLFSMDIGYIRLMFLFLFFSVIYDYTKIILIAYRKHKVYSAYLMLVEIGTILISIWFLFVMKDKKYARILGMILPTIVINIPVLGVLWKKGGKVRLSYIQSGLLMTIPLLPSALSSTILSSSDRTMITHYCGEEYNALYQMGYSIASIVAIIWAALNQVFGPWLYDNLSQKKEAYIKEATKKYALFFTLIVVGITGILPEVVLVMGGSKYLEAIDVVTPVVLGMIFQFYYAFYFDLEYYYGETYLISLGTMIAALLNLGLNFVFIPRYGYIAAAYTTFAGYVVLFLYHFLIVKWKLKKTYLYSTGTFLALMAAGVISQFIISWLYKETLIRYIFLGFYGAALLAYVFKNRKELLAFVRKTSN